MELGSVKPNAMHQFLASLPTLLNPKANKKRTESIEVYHTKCRWPA
ncbi:hypothetical protein [uncultured Helicobacter sp.]|nr:hypothetical protein [uncultured Helicobacter sp.]